MWIDAESGIVLFQTVGEVCYEEWVAQVRAALALHGGPLRRLLSDRREMTGDYEIGLVESAIDFFRANPEMLGEAQWAILVNDQSVAQRTATQAMQLAESTRIRVKVFTALRPALQWLLGAYDDEELERVEQWVNAQEERDETD